MSISVGPGKFIHDLMMHTFRMAAVSEHSTKKVLSPAMMRSLAPSRVNTRSTSVSRAAAAATRQPICKGRQQAQHEFLDRSFILL